MEQIKIEQIQNEHQNEEMKNLLKTRKELLLQIKKDKEKAIVTAPKGTLRISGHDDKVQYYQRNDPKDINGAYIRGKDIQLARGLAQKDYDQKVLRSTEQELSAINKYFSNYPVTCAEQIYEKLHKERRKLIEPIIEPEEQYVDKWEAVSYQGKGFSEDTPEFFTAKGERVRSKSEWIIADLLMKEAIPYRYEYPIQLKGMGAIYPDFTVLNVKKRKEMHWEHFGMMDDPSYVEKALQKIALYEQNGIFPGENLILTYETKKNPMNQKMIMLMIQHYLK
ncbi:MAG: hypothetical protein IJZ34_17805 [Lachnospiraceae bacterium]|nr:hypothetical protein [Lachnospiraceae bacterium]